MFLEELDRGVVPEAVVGAVVVVVEDKEIDPFPDLAQRLERVGVQDLPAQGPVEAFDVRVLGGLPGFNKDELDPLGLAPLAEPVADQLRAVVDPDHARQAARGAQLLEHSDHTGGGQAHVRLDPQRLAVEVVHDVEQAEPAPVPQAVVHEVHRPHGVRRLGGEQALLGPRRQASAAPAPDAQPHRRVDAVQALVVDRVAMVAKPPVRLPEADAGVGGDKLGQAVDPRAVAAVPGHVGDRRAGHARGLAGLQHAQPVPVHELEGKFLARYRPPYFFSMTCLRASLTRLSSEYMRFRRAFSSSSSLMRLSSLTLSPPYLLRQL